VGEYWVEWVGRFSRSRVFPVDFLSGEGNTSLRGSLTLEGTEYARKLKLKAQERGTGDVDEVWDVVASGDGSPVSFESTKAFSGRVHQFSRRSCIESVTSDPAKEGVGDPGVRYLEYFQSWAGRELQVEVPDGCSLIFCLVGKIEAWGNCMRRFPAHSI